MCTHSPAFLNHTASPHSEAMQMAVTCCLDMCVQSRLETKCLFYIHLSFPSTQCRAVYSLLCCNGLEFFCSQTLCSMFFLFFSFFYFSLSPLSLLSSSPNMTLSPFFAFFISLHLLYFPLLSFLVHTRSSADKRQREACGCSYYCVNIVV